MSGILNTDILGDHRIIFLDSDGVCIRRGTHIRESISEDTYSLVYSTSVISNELADMLVRLSDHMMVVISSGRSMIYLMSMYSKVIGHIGVMAENGGLYLSDGNVVQITQLDREYVRAVSRMRSDIGELDILGIEPKELILTIHSSTEHMGVYDIVRRHDTRDMMQVMWNGEAFDIQPRSMSKGTGVRYILDRYMLSPGDAIAIGDRINDKEMLDAVGTPVSADVDTLPAPYYTIGSDLPGQILVSHLLSTLEE